MNLPIDVDDTIVAISSSHSPATRGVVRLTGHESLALCSNLGLESNGSDAAHFINASIHLGDTLGAIPVRALFWPTSRSYTGQPSAEIHTFGCLPILQAVVESFLTAGARAARPGEFTLRAFLAGRLDLTQAEAVLGVIDAEHRASLDHALRQLAGNLSRPLEQLRSVLLDLLADVEAGLDFVDEDIQFISDADLERRLQSVLNSVRNTRRQLTQRSYDQSRPDHHVAGITQRRKKQPGQRDGGRRNCDRR